MIVGNAAPFEHECLRVFGEAGVSVSVVGGVLFESGKTFWSQRVGSLSWCERLFGERTNRIRLIWCPILIQVFEERDKEQYYD